jgi:hypothetical protein
VERGGGLVSLVLYTYVSKCKNNKIKNLITQKLEKGTFIFTANMCEKWCLSTTELCRSLSKRTRTHSKASTKGKKQDGPIWKITIAKRAGGAGSTGRGPAWNVWGPEFKLNTLKKKTIRLYYTTLSWRTKTFLIREGRPLSPPLKFVPEFLYRAIRQETGRQANW